MSRMIIMVLDDPDKLTDVMRVWQHQGASGITILESSGLGRALLAAGGMICRFSRGCAIFFRPARRTIVRCLPVVGDEVDVEAFFTATEEVVGPLDAPNSGLIVALPVLAARGIMQRDRPLGG